jgi:hypothetical protein
MDVGDFSRIKTGNIILGLEYNVSWFTKHALFGVNLIANDFLVWEIGSQNG